MPYVSLKMKSYIQPFEKRLAWLELDALLGDSTTGCTRNIGGSASFDTRKSPTKLAQKLTYWESVHSKDFRYTDQVLRELTANVVRGNTSFEQLEKILPFEGGVTLPNKRCLRYATHGIHEYTGKYFPQLVRSLLNIADLNVKSCKVLDPMCGSGTTLVESVLENYTAFGFDINPLSVFISRVKCSVIKKDPLYIQEEFVRIRESLLNEHLPRKFAENRHLFSLPQRDQIYLSNWFSSDTLLDLDRIHAVISTVSDLTIRDFFKVSLSNILRRISWQKDDDLRVRKEMDEGRQIDAIEEFLAELHRSVRLTVAFIRQNRPSKIGAAHVHAGDSNDLLNEFHRLGKRFDTVITSPPYATALPYLDTDRLSLFYLGLLSKNDYKNVDSTMIGNREIGEKKRQSLWQHYQEEKKSLPGSITSLIDKIYRLNQDGNAGFRRRNLPALLAKYFFDMKSVIAGTKNVTKSSGSIFMVVGDNYTVAGGERVNIPTIKLLSTVADSVGLQLIEKIDMEMLVNRNAHKKNATKAESILWFKAPSR